MAPRRLWAPGAIRAALELLLHWRQPSARSGTQGMRRGGRLHLCCAPLLVAAREPRDPPGDLCRNQALDANQRDEAVFFPSAARVPALAREEAPPGTALAPKSAGWGVTALAGGEQPALGESERPGLG